MGILDDAIREHLELKRSHGAGESELQQLEDEAFGLPTRPGEPDFPERSDEDGDRAEAAAMEHPVVEVEAEPADVDVPAAEELVELEPLEPAPVEPAPVEPAPVEPAPVEPAPVEPAAEEPDEAQGQVTEEHEAAAVFDRSEGEDLGLGDLDLELADEIDEGLEEIGADDEPPSVADEPVEGEEPAADEEDVLEETPEFLQDRPEDDELWFEQGKPKDFDF